MTTDGLITPAALHALISREVHSIIAEQYALLNDTILPALAAEGIVFLRRSAWTDAQHLWARDYFMREVMPVLTPDRPRPGPPFPRVLNKSLNFAVELEGRDAFGRNSGAAIVQAPRPARVIRRRRSSPASTTASCSCRRCSTPTWASSSADERLGCYQFRVTRNLHMFVDEEEVKDLRATLRANSSSATSATRCGSNWPTTAPGGEMAGF